MSDQDLKKYYDILEIDGDASEEEITQAYNYLKDLYSSDSMAIQPMDNEWDENEKHNILEQVEEAYAKLMGFSPEEEVPVPEEEVPVPEEAVPIEEPPSEEVQFEELPMEEVREEEVPEEEETLQEEYQPEHAPIVSIEFDDELETEDEVPKEEAVEEEPQPAEEEMVVEPLTEQEKTKPEFFIEEEEEIEVEEEPAPVISIHLDEEEYHEPVDEVPVEEAPAEEAPIGEVQEEEAVEEIPEEEAAEEEVEEVVPEEEAPAEEIPAFESVEPAEEATEEPAEEPAMEEEVLVEAEPVEEKKKEDTLAEEFVPSGPIDGAVLKALRESRGLSVDELANSTQISAEILGFIEEEDFDHLPDAGFLRWQISTLAKTLSLDPKESANEYMKHYRDWQRKKS